MARPKNPDMRYTLTCKVTGVATPTNPKQFNDMVLRYGISPEELDSSYVNRQGRRIIAGEKLTPEQASEKYGIHINVANLLKCTLKPSVIKTAPDKVEDIEATNPESVDSMPVTVDTVDENGRIIETSDTGFTVSIPVEDENLVEV